MTKKDLYYKNKYIKELKAKNFKNNLVRGGDKSKYMVIIYSPDCELCKQQYDLFTEAAILYNSFNFYAINCFDIKECNDKLCSELDITTYPTLLYKTKDNKLHKFKKQINYKTLEKFLNFN